MSIMICSFVFNSQVCYNCTSIAKATPKEANEAYKQQLSSSSNHSAKQESFQIYGYCSNINSPMFAQ
jgi:hypothetical protein